MKYISTNYKRFLTSIFITIISIVIIYSREIPLLSTITVYGSENNEDWPEIENEPYGKAFILMERDTGAILYGKNIDEKLYPASITKIMTALLVVENLSLQDTITFTSDMIDSLPIEAAIQGVLAGETITVKDCLYSLILRSSNDISTGLAFTIAGSEEEFGKMMTERAKELGAVNTNFVNSTGLHDENHYTTARDMALITEAAMRNPILSSIWGTDSYVLNETNMTESFKIKHRHEMIAKVNPTTVQEYEVVNDKENNDIELQGGKTGFTDEAGRTLVTAAKNNEMELISVILYSSDEYVYNDTMTLLEYGFNNYRKVTIDGNEERFGQGGNADFSIVNKISENNKSLFVLDNESVIIPKKTSLSDIDFEIDNNIDNTGRGEFAKVTYVHENQVLGSTILYVSGTYNKESIKKFILEKENITIEVTGNQKIYFINIYYIIGGIIAFVVFAFLFYRIRVSKGRFKKII